MVLTLHCFGESGHSYKVALTMTLAGLDWSPAFVDYFNGETRKPAFRALNAMGEVPVLVDGALTLVQSGVILLYLAERTGLFGGESAQDRAEILRWILFDGHKLSSNAGSVRYLSNFLPAAQRKADVIAFLTTRLTSALAIVEAHLSTRDWLVGDGPTIADFACCSYLYYPEPFAFDRAAWPAVSAWLDRIAALPGWRHPYDLMPRAWTS